MLLHFQAGDTIIKTIFLRISPCFFGFGGGGGAVKIQSCLEWPETYFGFGIFEIQ